MASPPQDDDAAATAAAEPAEPVDTRVTLVPDELLRTRAAAAGLPEAPRRRI